MIYRNARREDLQALKKLALASWSIYQHELTEKNWTQLKSGLERNDTYLELLEIAYSLVCENKGNEIIGMAFLVPSGNPT